MRYSEGFRKDVLEAIAKGMPKKEASRRFNINLSTIKEWCRSCGVEPDIAVCAVKRKRLSAEERAAAVFRVEAEELISAVAREAGVTYQAVYRWLCSKKQPDGIYYTQEDGCMDRHDNIEDLKLEVKALKDEVEYLTAKAAYLGALLELSGMPAGKFKKKKMRSNLQSSPERSRKRKDALLDSRCLTQELLPLPKKWLMRGPCPHHGNAIHSGGEPWGNRLQEDGEDDQKQHGKGRE